MEKPYFPMFIDLSGKKILMVGGGGIALRRVRTLLKFRVDILVVAPKLCGGLAKLAQEGKIRAEHREYRDSDTEGTDIVLAATDSSEVNRHVWKVCRKAGIPVNVADDRNLCDFYFPSVVMNEEVVIGINSGGSDPGKVKETRQKIEKLFSVSSPGKVFPA